MKIQEVIIVEGIHDQDAIIRAVNADTLVTHGTHISKELLDFIEQLHKLRGVIIFTDPDTPGDQIRKKIMQRIGGCKHATLSNKQSRSKGKVGIEHASSEDIKEALLKVVSFDHRNESLTWHEFLDLGLTGLADSKLRREKVCRAFALPYANAKTLFQYLNMCGLTSKKIEGEL
jgi:ribonuclease M5